MSGPGYVYLVGRENEHGAWAKVGVAARIGRVQEHRGWKMLHRTVGPGCLFEAPRSLEQEILRHFAEKGGPRNQCGRCAAPKPPVGRTGSDGLTEVRHLNCYQGLPAFFEERWERAPRIEPERAGRMDFDPLSLRPGGFVPVREPWRQPPRMDPGEYQANACNVLCVQSVPAAQVVDWIDRRWESGEVDLRKALWNQYRDAVCKVDGTPTPNAKGSGARAQRGDVETKLATMTRIPGVEIVLVSVRNLGLLYAYVAVGSLEDG